MGKPSYRVGDKASQHNGDLGDYRVHYPGTQGAQLLADLLVVRCRGFRETLPLPMGTTICDYRVIAAILTSQA